MNISRPILLEKLGLDLICGIVAKSGYIVGKSIYPNIYNMLFIKDISPNGNFIVDADGITYIYGRYEIGPYVSGIVKVSVPWSEIKDILK